MSDKLKGVLIDTKENEAKIAELNDDEIRNKLHGGEDDYSPFIVPVKVKDIDAEINIFSICDISETFKDIAKNSIPSAVYKKGEEIKPLTFKNVFILAGCNDMGYKSFRSLTDAEIQKVMAQLTQYNEHVCLLVSELL